MTLLCFHTMGCGQSIRKKTKHKGEGNTEEINTYDNQTYGTTPSTGSALSKPLVTVVSSRSPDADNGRHGSTDAEKTLSSNHTKSDNMPLKQLNGDIRLSYQDPESKLEQEKVRRDSGLGAGKFGLQLQCKMTASQLEFFRILDEKIEQGNDYDVSDEGT